MSERYHVLSRSDASILIPILKDHLHTAEQHCEAAGFDPFEIPYYLHVRAVYEDLLSLLDQSSK